MALAAKIYLYIAILSILTTVLFINLLENNENMLPEGYKTIVFWNNVKISLNGGAPNSINYFKQIECPETRCKVVMPHEKHLHSIEKYDAFVFYGVRHQISLPLPSERFPHQLYIFASREPPRGWWHEEGEINTDIEYNATSM